MEERISHRIPWKPSSHLRIRESVELDDFLAADVVLRQPLGPTTRGLPTGKRAFGKIFTAIPDLHAEVDRWAATDDGVLIEFRLIGIVGGHPTEWPAVDRLVLEDGMATERCSYARDSSGRRCEVASYGSRRALLGT